jgi:TonB family protein
MIVVVVLAVLAAIALPSYTDYVVRSKLTEAHTHLADLRVKMEQRFQDARTYVAASAAPKEKPETLYYSAPEVDVRAVPLGEIVPVNPDLTGRESGSVVLRLYISATGAVDKVVVVRAEPHRIFGPQIMLPFQQARFLPARKSGLAVNSEMLIEVRYGPLEGDKP